MNANSFDKLVTRLKGQCSFHLFAPMAEAYFFANPAALRATGYSGTPNLVANCDVENFTVADQAFLSAPVQPAAIWACDPRFRKHHAKHYLEYLLEPVMYSETGEGVRALKAIDWNQVLAKPDQTLLLRSLFQDLAYALGLPAASFPGDTHPSTSGQGNRNRILRNC
jgi:hypothetical protein